MGTVKNIQRLLMAAVLSGLWLGWIGFGPGTDQAAGASLSSAVTTERKTVASCSVPGSLEGVDVNQSDGTIDWAQVAQTKAFAYAKASDGPTYADPAFLTNYAGIKQAAMKAGAYLFFHPGQDPTQQANLLVSQLLKAGFSAGDLVPMIDVEHTDGKTSQEIAASLQTAVDVVKSSLLVTPGIYSYAGFFATPTAWTAFAGNPLWIAYFSANCPTVPLPWTDWAIWQYSDTGTVPGIPLSSVDHDRSNGASLPVFTGSRRTFLPLITSNR